MARVRKSLDKTKQIRALWKVALYIRLSREDGNDESYSVKNQRQRLKEYLENLMPEEETQLVDIYIDGADIIGLNQKTPFKSYFFMSLCRG